MKEFLLVFRADWSGVAKRSEEEAQANTKQWMDWIGSIAAQNKLVTAGSRLMPTGKVVKAKGLVTDGPYAEIKETIGGFTIVKTTTYEEAVELSKSCPAVNAPGGSVEVREINPM